MGNYKFIITLFLALGIMGGLQQIALGPKNFDDSGISYTHHNNYVIYKNSFTHLMEGKDLYVLWPQEQWDLYKYSPTFALFFAPFAMLPDVIGLSLWNLLNALVLVIALMKIPGLKDKARKLLFLFILVEFITSMQNTQANAMVCGLTILTFVFLEDKKYLLASLCVMLNVYVKIFGLVSLALFLMYPNRLKSVAYSAMWFIVLLVLPVFFIGYNSLMMQYKSWLFMLQNDYSASYGLSVMGWLNSWFGITPDKMLVIATGAVFFCVPLIFYKRYNNYQFRYLTLASILIWVIIFNHKAESATFILASTGVALWYFIKKRGVGDTILLFCVLVFTVLSPTDIFPPYVKKNFIYPYVLKAVPVIFVWCKLWWEMMVAKEDEIVA